MKTGCARPNRSCFDSLERALAPRLRPTSVRSAWIQSFMHARKFVARTEIHAALRAIRSTRAELAIEQAQTRI